MTPELPIDIVYTWVNGSDPPLIEKLRHLKQDLILKQNRYVRIYVILCMYVYMYSCMYVCVYACMYVGMYIIM